MPGEIIKNVSRIDTNGTLQVDRAERFGVDEHTDEHDGARDDGDQIVIPRRPWEEPLAGSRDPRPVDPSAPAYRRALQVTKDR